MSTQQHPKLGGGGGGGGCMHASTETSFATMHAAIFKHGEEKHRSISEAMKSGAVSETINSK